MRRLSVTRLLDAERRAPAPWEPMTFIHALVDPNPTPGGPPIVVGVYKRATLQRHGPPIVEWFDPPVPEAELPPP